MENNINAIITATLKQFAHQIEKKASTLLKAEGLEKIVPVVTIKVEPNETKLNIKLQGYNLYIEYGVKGTEKIPTGAEESPYAFKTKFAGLAMANNIQKWALSKGLQPRKSSLPKTNSHKKIRPSETNTQQQMAFAIATSLKKSGISPKKILPQIFTKEMLKNLSDNISEAIKQNVIVNNYKN